MNYYFIIIAFLIVFIVWMYFATKNAPEEEDKVINLTFNINTEPEEPKEVPSGKTKRPGGRPRKTIK